MVGVVSKPSTIILWVHPRSCSTMFEQSLLSQGNVRVLHEPMGDSFYFGKERRSMRFGDQELKEKYSEFAEGTYRKSWDNMVHPTPEQAEGHTRTFSKDMAQYLFPAVQDRTTGPAPSMGPSDNDSLIPSSELLSRSISHTFLLRDPRKAVPSYARLCEGESAKVTGFLYFDKDEAGYKELRQLFDIVKAAREERGEGPPLVIQSEDLLANPAAYMSAWCAEVGLEYSDSMLSWDEGQQEHFRKWAGFHEAAENSTGIGRGVRKEHATQHDQDKQYPPEVMQGIEQSVADWEYLKGFAKKL